MKRTFPDLLVSSFWCVHASLYFQNMQSFFSQFGQQFKKSVRHSRVKTTIFEIFHHYAVGGDLSIRGFRLLLSGRINSRLRATKAVLF